MVLFFSADIRSLTNKNILVDKLAKKIKSNIKINNNNLIINRINK